MSGGHSRRQSLEHPPPEIHDENNLLAQPMLQRLINQPQYEMFGFVYKIKAYEFNKYKPIDLKNLKRVELN